MYNIDGLDRRIEEAATLAALSISTRESALESGAMSETIRDPQFWITFGQLIYRQAYTNNARAKRKGIFGRVETSDLANQYEKQNGACFYCQRDLNCSFHIDHVIPLSRGGQNVKENIVLSCADCNQSKASEEKPKPRQMDLLLFEGGSKTPMATKVPASVALYVNKWCSVHRQSVSEYIREAILLRIRFENEKRVAPVNPDDDNIDHSPKEKG